MAFPTDPTQLSTDRTEVTYNAVRAGGGDFSFSLAQAAAAAAVEWGAVQNTDDWNTGVNNDNTPFENYGQSISVSFPS